MECCSAGNGSAILLVMMEIRLVGSSSSHVDGVDWIS